MATGGEIAEAVLGTVQDDSFDEDSVIKLLNDCMSLLSRRLILPSLDAEATVTTVTNAHSVALPATFQRNLYHCQDGNDWNAIEVCNSKDQLSRYYDPRLGKANTYVKGVAAVRPLLYYAPMPTVATTLTLRFQRLPSVITGSTEVDTILPQGFSDIFENYATWKLYSKIEQGMESAKVDTGYYMNLFLGMFDELKLSLTEGVSMPAPPIAQMERW